MFPISHIPISSLPDLILWTPSSLPAHSSTAVIFPKRLMSRSFHRSQGLSSRGSGPSEFVTFCTGAILTVTKRNPMSGPSGVTPESPTVAPDFTGLRHQPACQRFLAALLFDDVVEETFCIGGSAFLRPAPRVRRHDSIEGSSRCHRQNQIGRASCR